MKPKRDQSINQIRKYVWLMNTLYNNPKGLSRKEIDSKWADNDIDEKDEIPPRTLHKWIDAIWDIFHVSIENENRGEYKYVIDREEIKNNKISQWMFDTIAVGSMLDGLKSRVLLEDRTTGFDGLQTILEAMEKNRTIHISYQSYWKEEKEDFDFEPYWVELQDQRWYVVGHRIGREGIEDYGIERIEEISVYQNKIFTLPKDKDGDVIQPTRHYSEKSGLETDDEKNVKVRLYVEANQQKYIRSQKLHHSQKEVEQGDDYSIFEYLLPRITYGFMKKVLSYTPYVIVLEPQSLRNEIAWRAKDLDKKYNG